MPLMPTDLQQAPQGQPTGLPPTADAAQSAPQPDAQQLMMAIAGNTHGGAIPMRPGHGVEAKYPGLRSMGHADWRQVSPRLLEVLDKLAQKHEFTVVIDSGYRDHRHNARVGGHPNSSHKRGIAVDAFVAGHPLGEVVSPDELAKLGLDVGGPNGDPSHVELMGIPLKKQEGSRGNTAGNSQQVQGPSGEGSMDLPPGGVGPGPPGLVG